MVFQITPTTTSTSLNINQQFDVEIEFTENVEDDPLRNLQIAIFYDSSELDINLSNIDVFGVPILGSIIEAADSTNLDEDSSTDTAILITFNDGTNILDFQGTSLASLPFLSLTGFDGGTINVEVLNSNPNIAQVTDNLVLTLNVVNQAPVITSSNSATVAENQTTAIDVNSNEEGGNGVTYSITGGTDASLFSIDSSSGLVTFKNAPNFEVPSDAGANNVYNFQVSVRDSGGLSDVENISITVTNVNEAPTITSSNSTAVAENQTTAIDVNSNDPDGNTVTYSITGGADASLFSINSSTGLVTFNNAPNFEAPSDAGGNNIYDFQVTVRDSGGLSDVENISVTVTNVNETPTITSSNSASVVENQTTAIDVNSNDPDGNTVTYSITGGADASLFSINSSTGLVTFNNAPNFEAPSDAGGNNIYDFQVTVRDSGGLSDVENINITVTNVNETPTITSSNNASVAENQTTAIDIQSIDDSNSEGNGLTYSITGGADASLFSINSSTGLVTFKNAPKFDTPSDAGGNNIYDFQVTVRDSGGLSDVENISITVTNVNLPPTITSLNSTAVLENQTTAIDVNSNEEGGNGVTYSITGGADASLFSINSSTGLVTFKNAPNFETPSDSGANNVYNFQVTVRDSGGLSDVENISITVTNVNEAPTITSLNSTAVAENQTTAIDVNSNDPDGNTVTYSITGGTDASLFTINSSTGLVTFNNAPNFEVPSDVGGNNIYDFQVTVRDSGGLSDVENISVTVTNVNDAPTITSSNSTAVVENQTTAIDVNSNDPDGNTVTYSITGGADASLFSINSSTGLVTFNNAPNFEVPSDVGGNNIYDFQVTVRDSGGLSDVENISITVTNVNEAPTITSSSSVTVATNQTTAINVQSTDDSNSEGNGLTYSITGGVDASLFSINSNTGLVTFKSPPTLENPQDSGANNIYDFQVTVTDSGGLTDVQDFAITVTDSVTNIVYVVDISNSSKQSFDNGRTALQAQIEMYQDLTSSIFDEVDLAANEVNIAIVAYSYQGFVVNTFDFNDSGDRDAINNALSGLSSQSLSQSLILLTAYGLDPNNYNVSFNGTTNMDDALDEVVAFFDGQNTESTSLTNDILFFSGVGSPNISGDGDLGEGTRDQYLWRDRDKSRGLQFSSELDALDELGVQRVALDLGNNTSGLDSIDSDGTAIDLNNFADINNFVSVYGGSSIFDI
jgi:hypothetical protein